MHLWSSSIRAGFAPIMAPREISALRTLDLDNARTPIGERARAAGRGHRLFDADHQYAFKRGCAILRPAGPPAVAD
jgi:hypothetical protein